MAFLQSPTKLVSYLIVPTLRRPAGLLSRSRPGSPRSTRVRYIPAPLLLSRTSKLPPRRSSTLRLPETCLTRSLTLQLPPSVNRLRSLLHLLTSPPNRLGIPLPVTRRLTPPTAPLTLNRQAKVAPKILTVPTFVGQLGTRVRQLTLYFPC